VAQSGAAAVKASNPNAIAPYRSLCVDHSASITPRRSLELTQERPRTKADALERG
jgi:hypothetical protein